MIDVGRAVEAAGITSVNHLVRFLMVDQVKQDAYKIVWRAAWGSVFSTGICKDPCWDLLLVISLGCKRLINLQIT